MSAPALDRIQHPSWCDRAECLPDGDGPYHSSTTQYWTTSTERQEVCLWLAQTPGEAPHVILGDAKAPVEHTLLLTLEEAADLMGRLAPLVAAAMPRGRCTR